MSASPTASPPPLEPFAAALSRRPGPVCGSIITGPSGVPEGLRVPYAARVAAVDLADEMGLQVTSTGMLSATVGDGVSELPMASSHVPPVVACAAIANALVTADLSVREVDADDDRWESVLLVASPSVRRVELLQDAVREELAGGVFGDDPVPASALAATLARLLEDEFGPRADWLQAFCEKAVDRLDLLETARALSALEAADAVRVPARGRAQRPAVTPADR